MQTDLNFYLQKAFDFLAVSQNADGGWGYRRGGQSYVEPTAFALLALFNPAGAGGQNVPDSRYQAVRRGLVWLRSQQHADGGWGVMRDDAVSGWMTYPVVWMLNVLLKIPELFSYYGDQDYKDVRDRGRGYILAKGREPSVEPEVNAQVQKLFRIDSLLRGWSWGAGEAGWVIPTSLAMLALTVEDPPIMQQNKDIINAKDYLRDRACPDGGWNVGNPWMLGKKLPATADATSFALVAWRAALTTSDFGPNAQVINAGLDYLEANLRNTNSDHTYALSAWAMSLFKEPAERADIRKRLINGLAQGQERAFTYKNEERKIRTLQGQDKDTGGWANSAYTTAIASFALTESRYYLDPK